MGGISISRLALAIAMCGVFALPPTASFAAPEWLEKMFAPDRPKSSKKRKPRPAARSTDEKIRLPDTAPVPDLGARDTTETDAPVPETKPPVAATQPEPPQEAVKEEPAQDVTPPSAAQFEDPSDQHAPAEPPKPEFRPDLPEPEAAGPVEPPTPEVRPDDPAPPTAEPGDPPKPEPRPHRPEPDIVDTEKAEPAPLDPRSALRPDPSGQLPEEEVACRRRLTELGVEFSEHKAESEPEGCSIPYPVIVKSLGSGVGLQPQAEMNCAMAEASARFAKDVISPHAQKIFREKLKSISHASAYVCRPRAGTQKLSEHAFGNALDIGSFTLSGGTTIAIELAPPEKNGKFVDTIRRSACGPFKTVLGPGDPDHSEHLHFDLAPRTNGGIVCE
jgi:hypothetical protein